MDIDKNYGFRTHPSEWDVRELYSYCINNGLIDPNDEFDEWEPFKKELVRIIVTEEIKGHE